MSDSFYYELCKLMHKLAVRNGNLLPNVTPDEWWVEQKLMSDAPICLVCSKKICESYEIVNRSDNTLFIEHARQHAKEYGLLILL